MNNYYQNYTKVRNNIKLGALIIDSSTISPFSAIEFNKNAAKHNITYLDAPVSGGVGGAAAGTLSFMLGTNDEGNIDVYILALYSRCEPVLKTMGKNIFKCEKIGGG